MKRFWILLWNRCLELLVDRDSSLVVKCNVYVIQAQSGSVRSSSDADQQDVAIELTQNQPKQFKTNPQLSLFNKCNNGSGIIL